MDAKKIIQQARANLVLEQPFFGALALRLRLVIDPSCKTLWTDGSTLGFNPDYVYRLSLAEVQGVVAHEVMHCAMGHPWRRGGRERTRWNMACDHAVNPIIVEANMALPAGALDDSRYKGLSAEQIYERLYELPSPRGGGEGEGEGGQGAGGTDTAPEAPGKGDQGRGDTSPGHGSPDGGDMGCGEVRDARGDDVQAQQADWKVATIQAAQAAKSQGKLPASLARLVEEMAKAKIDWRSALWRFIQKVAREDYSWKLPNRRFISRGLYLPSLRNETMPTIAVAVDTSGSISQKELNEFAAEITSIMNDVKPEHLYVIYCDAQVHGVEEFQAGDQVKLSPRGGGGTDFRPVFDYINSESLDPACLIYLTDTFGTFPKDEPDFPILWVSTVKETNVPFGEFLQLE